MTLEEFISGLLTMKGPAKAIDVKTIAAGPGEIWGDHFSIEMCSKTIGKLWFNGI